mgnify:CR=1 FL=1
MPDISAACDVAPFLVVVRDLDARQNPFGRRDLIRTHDQKQVFGRKNTVSRQNIEQGVSRKKCLRKIGDVWDDPVVCICPETRKLTAVARLSLLCVARFMLFDCVKPRAVRVILGVCAVADHKDLDIFKQAAAGPE